MGISFFPKVVKFFDLFEKQSKMVKDATELLNSIFQDFSDVPAKCERINRLEAEGDSLSREISTELALTFITPLDREDIHAINMAQEDVLNMIKAVSSRIGLYRFKKLERAAVDLVENLRLITGETESMIRKLASRKTVEEHSRAVNKIKNESELHLLVALGELYESGPLLPEGLLYIMMWTQIYDRIEQALEKAEHLSNILEGVSIKNA
ncbi:MAG: DUF47 family protein [Smithellaceae bacterium]|nr:DUF47 family protein [Syntrophaceae bacterium]MDD4240609.1 DUF47 family protein [Smithellaceae bacterium]NLX52057.1 DUF47 family protein [Deltaproteobacteria bacterium]